MPINYDLLTLGLFVGDDVGLVLGERVGLTVGSGGMTKEKKRCKKGMNQKSACFCPFFPQFESNLRIPVISNSDNLTPSWVGFLVSVHVTLYSKNSSL